MALFAVLVSLTGCTRIMQGILFGMSERTARRHVAVAVPASRTQLAALSTARGSSALKLTTEVPAGLRTFGRRQAARAKSAAAQVARRDQQDRIDAAFAILDDETVKSIVNASNAVLARAGRRAAGRSAASLPIKLPTNRAGWTSLYRKLEDATLKDSWSALAEESRAYAATLKVGSKAEIAAARTLGRLAYYVRHYIRAYFTGMPLVRVKVDLTKFTKRLEESIRKRLRKLDPEMKEEEVVAKAKEILARELKDAVRKLLKKEDVPKLDEIVDKLLAHKPLDNVWGYTLGSDEGEAVGFTSRAGEKFMWPTIEVSINPSADDIISWSDIDAKAVGSQLMRLFIEAVFDAQLGVPAVPSATAVGFPEEYRLEAYQPPEQGQAGVTTEEFNAINDWAGRAEGVASSSIGRLIRGIGWISLNNESLAELIETTVGVMVRKLVEAALWERYHDRTASRGENALAAARVQHAKITFEFTDLSRPSDG